MDAEQGGSDQSRKLSDFGVNKAEELADKLRPYTPDRVAVSPAIRTRETLAHLSKVLKINQAIVASEPSLYFGTAEDYLSCIESFSQGIQRLWVIGHNPMVSYLAHNMCSDFVGGFDPANALVLEAKEQSQDFIKSNWTLVEQIK